MTCAARSTADQAVLLLAGYNGHRISEHFSHRSASDPSLRIHVRPPRGTATDLRDALSHSALQNTRDILVCTCDTVVEYSPLDLLAEHRRLRSPCTILLTGRRGTGIQHAGAYKCDDSRLVLATAEGVPRPLGETRPVWSGSSTGIVVFNADYLRSLVGRWTSLYTDLLPWLVAAQHLRAVPLPLSNFVFDYGTPFRYLLLRTVYATRCSQVFAETV